MSDTGKSGAARTEGATATDRSESSTTTDRAEAAATTSSEAATATCVEAATSAVPAEPSAARFGSPYRNGKRKEGQRRDRSNVQVFRHRTLPVHFLNPVDDPTDRIVTANFPLNSHLRVLLVEYLLSYIRPPLHANKGTLGAFRMHV